MSLMSYQGYFKDGRFITSTKRKITIPENAKVIVTVLPEENLKKRPRSELCGILKGKVWMADDFNAPLEEMKEYME